MAKLGAMSLARLGECHPDLQKLIKAYVQRLPADRDITVLCGYRGQKDQDEAFTKGNSKLRWPKSKHNRYPSHAVDIAPYPVNWNDLDGFKEQREEVLLLAHDLGINIRVIAWDWPHFEIV